ncbi:MAG: cob(I)yrinic acid a,c-diamide adenosyltransferase [Chloroflexota bacterium]
MSRRRFFTGNGDNGTTGLLGEGRISKNHLRIEVLGCLDETTAALGFARSLSADQEITRVVLQIQHELYQLMAEIAATPEHAEQFRVISTEHVQWLEQQADHLSEAIELPREFILPGDTPAAGAFSLARAICRRAERRVVELNEREGLGNPFIIPYLNRLSSLCFVLELYETQIHGKARPTLAKQTRP